MLRLTRRDRYNLGKVLMFLSVITQGAVNTPLPTLSPVRVPIESAIESARINRAQLRQI